MQCLIKMQNSSLQEVVEVENINKAEKQTEEIPKNPATAVTNS